MVKRKRRVSDFKPDIFHRVGIAWFEPESYARLLDVMPKPHGMPGNYERWREITENSERYSKRGGHLVVRVVIDPDKFIAWCAARTLQPNSDAIERFVAQQTYGISR